MNNVATAGSFPMRDRCVTPGFDVTAQRKKDGTVFLNISPALGHDWLTKVSRRQPLGAMSKDWPCGLARHLHRAKSLI